MKKTLFITSLLIASFTRAQVTLSTATNFTDFIVSGLNTASVTQNNDPTYLSFTAKGYSTTTLSINKTFSSNVVFDSIVTKYTLFTYTLMGNPIALNSATVAIGTSSVRTKVSNTNSVSLTFNISLPDTGSTIRFSNLSVIGYANSTAMANLPSNPSHVRVYPNPTRNKVFLDEISDVKLFDLNGKLLLQQTKTSELDLTNLEPGFYLLGLSSGIGHKTVKIVKE
ncbi:MAG: T9SS type A sorting domain-containing protein [Bacteroidia bacterium]|nr:T9SS type A sorting domain-containing protein [Bacteroidia bacterium]